ncbi:MAG: TFIIB-type zinc ribbon-containing protein [Candidatus Aenigmatarchaeota archaeon]
MNCMECGSDRMAYDPAHDNKYCKDCGIVLEEQRFW